MAVRLGFGHGVMPLPGGGGPPGPVEAALPLVSVSGSPITLVPYVPGQPGVHPQPGVGDTIITDFRTGSSLGTDLQAITTESEAKSFIDDFNGTQGKVGFTTQGPGGTNAYVLRWPNWGGNTGDRSIDLGTHVPTYPTGVTEAYFQWKFWWGRIAGDGTTHGRLGDFDSTNDEAHALCSGFSGSFSFGEAVNFSSGGATGIVGDTDNSTYLQFEVMTGNTPTSGTATGVTSGATCTINSSTDSTLNAGGKRFRTSGVRHDQSNTPGASIIMGASDTRLKDGKYSDIQWRVVGDGLASVTTVYTGGTYDPLDYINRLNTMTLHVKCASNDTATDGQIELWINDVKEIEVLSARTRMANFNRWKVPTTLRDPERDFTEYVWDQVAWTP